MKPRISMRAALQDPALLGGVLAGPSWRPWRTLLIAAMGEPLDADECVLFAELTGGRQYTPGTRIDELVAVVGRRGGKSRAMATLAVYISALCDHDDALVPGEIGVLLSIAPDQRQAAITLDYAGAAFDQSPLLQQLVINRTADAITLANRITIEVRAASFRRLRGPTYIGVIADEAAFWHSEDSSNPDTEIIGACRPGLATTGGPLIIASSPYARRGVVWDAYRRHYGPAGDPLILVAQGASQSFNSKLPQSVVERAMERDPAAARAEYLAQFRTDLESFVSREVVGACVMTGRHELPPLSGVAYCGFVDPSGGSQDSMTLAIAHRDKDGIAVLDAVRERRPPFSPEAVVEEFATLLAGYRITKVVGDHYAGEWPRERFRFHGIAYEPCEQSASDIFRDTLPLLNSGRVQLLDHPRLTAQLCSLERRVARSGKDLISHPPGGHDDVANAACGALLNAVSAKRPMVIPTDPHFWAQLRQPGISLPEWRYRPSPEAMRSQGFAEEIIAEKCGSTNSLKGS